MTLEEKLWLKYDWNFWARPKQLPPPWLWRVWALVAGRGFGKTRPGSEIVRFWAWTQPGCRIALVGATAADVRDVMILGESGILETSPPWFKPKYLPSKRRLEWPNGTQAFAYSTQEPERLRGPQHHKAWFDELCAARKQEVWKHLMLGLRLPYDGTRLVPAALGDYQANTKPQCVVTTTPKPQELLRKLRDRSEFSKLPVEERARVTVAWTQGRTIENRANLSPEFIEEIYQELAGTRLGAQELDAEMIDDAEGALWRRCWIDDHRFRSKGKVPLPPLKRRGVAVDPKKQKATSSGAEYGIVAGGLGADGHVYVTGDYSGRLTAAQAYTRTIEALRETSADFLVIELNRWGQEFLDGLKRAARDAGYALPRVRTVQVQEGKATRAEPYTAPYELGHVHHVDELPELESQLCGWVPGDSKSPDRLDALVHLLAELLPAIKQSRGSSKRPDGW